MNNVIKAIEDSMQDMGLNYAFMRWNGKPAYPYFVGEYTEVESITEDGYQETPFMLNGFSRGSWFELEQQKGLIENYFNKVTGKMVTTDNSVVAVFYANGFPVPTEEAELKRIQINLKVKEWKAVKE